MKGKCQKCLAENRLVTNIVFTSEGALLLDACSVLVSCAKRNGPSVCEYGDFKTTNRTNKTSRFIEIDRLRVYFSDVPLGQKHRQMYIPQ